ncbi:putative F-box/kelch-repeat protein At1g20790 [Eutrema salsugineum]|nr:putative F-box/kelch-repeat protein At1g20790 [Eutrema salsugineum]
MKHVYLDSTLHSLRNDESIIAFNPRIEEARIHTNPKWILTSQIRNEVVNESITLFWDMEAYNGKCLVVRTMTNLTNHRMVYVYDLRVNKWAIVGSMPMMCNSGIDAIVVFCYRSTRS